MNTDTFYASFSNDMGILEILQVCFQKLLRERAIFFLPGILGGSPVGVWNGWGYGIAFFRALNFRISEPEIW